MSNSKKIAIRGTEQNMLPGARAIGPSDPHQLVTVSVVLERHTQLPEHENQKGEKQNGATQDSSGQTRYMNHNDFASTYGANPANVDKIRKFARENNLQVLERGDEVLRRTVTLAGTAAAMEKAFSVELTEYEYENGSYRGYTGAVQLPEECSSCVTGVFGLDNRVAAYPRFRHRNHNRSFGERAFTTAYTPPRMAKLYGFPQDANGAGQTLGIIELGGGYRPSDIREYFQLLGLQPPSVRCISVDHADNRPTTAHSVDGVVMADIEMAGAIAPGVTIAVYFAPNTERGFLDAVNTAVHDQLNKPSVLSIGWGNSEVNWSKQAIETFHQVAQEAALLGITIAVASGDYGSYNGMNYGKSGVDFPASCPHVLSVGGTRLMAANGAIESETAWNEGPQGGATGGGYSTLFQRPAWQAAVVTQPGRGVPDVAANADPETGYNILVDGQHEVVGGTSLAAPMWAGLIILLNQKLNRRLGFVNPLLYGIEQRQGFRDITVGNNGAYSSTYGWDPLTGLGCPLGSQLLQALQGQVAHAQAQRKESMQAAPAH